MDGNHAPDQNIVAKQHRASRHHIHCLAVVVVVLVVAAVSIVAPAVPDNDLDSHYTVAVVHALAAAARDVTGVHQHATKPHPTNLSHLGYC